MVQTDASLTRRDAALAFAWSRMRVVGETEGADASDGATFTDFLEAVVRVASTRVLPTDDEIRTHGYRIATRPFRLPAPPGTCCRSHVLWFTAGVETRSRSSRRSAGCMRSTVS